MNKKPDLAYYDTHRVDLNHLLPKHAKRILEVGGGTGAFRQNFSPDAEYWLIEPVPEMADIARSRVDHVMVGTYNDAKKHLPDAYFDLVVCNDVIEHMPDWRDFLVDVQEKMTSDAVMVGSIPNVRHFVNVYNFVVRRDWEYTQTGILETTHFVFFTEISLKRELLRANFEIQAFERMKKFTYTRGQSLLKYAISRVIIGILGADSRYGQFGFRCASRNGRRRAGGLTPSTAEGQINKGGQS